MKLLIWLLPRLFPPLPAGNPQTARKPLVKGSCGQLSIVAVQHPALLSLFKKHKIRFDPCLEIDDIYSAPSPWYALGMELFLRKGLVPSVDAILRLISSSGRDANHIQLDLDFNFSLFIDLFLGYPKVIPILLEAANTELKEHDPKNEIALDLILFLDWLIV